MDNQREKRQNTLTETRNQTRHKAKCKNKCAKNIRTNKQNGQCFDRKLLESGDFTP